MAQRERTAPRAAERSPKRGTPDRSTPERAPAVDLGALRARLRTLAEPVVTAAGLDLEELTVARAGRRHVVRISVDGDDGVSHDELTEISRELSARLDEAEESAGALPVDSYTLELSSPGVDRPLTLPRHWRRNVGRLVAVRAGERTVTARILTVDEVGVSFDPAVLAEVVPFDRLGPGRVQVEFSRLADLSDDEIGDEIDDQLDGTDADEIDNDEGDDEREDSA
jgi:ribosome maturation factor RimP